jgi:hypothetical protein
MYFWYHGKLQDKIVIQQGSRSGEHIYQLPIPRVGERVKLSRKEAGIVEGVEYNYQSLEVNVHLSSPGN